MVESSSSHRTSPCTSTPSGVKLSPIALKQGLGDIDARLDQPEPSTALRQVAPEDALREDGEGGRISGDVHSPSIVLRLSHTHKLVEP